MKFILLLFLFLSFTISAQNFEPIINNYSKLDYNGESPIWDIDFEPKHNKIYFANNRNILVYDGNFWNKLSLHKLTIIRSIFVRNDKVYVGSLNDFGYWNTTTKEYHSIADTLKIFKNLEQEEIWKIFEYKNKIYFQSFNFLFIYDGKTVQRKPLPSLSSYFFVVNSKLYLATISKGIYELVDDQFKFKFQIIPNQPTVVHSIIPFKSSQIIGTLKDGIFVVDEHYNVKPFNSDLNNELKNALILKMLLHDNKLIIGTSNNGIYVYDLSSNSYKNYNQSTGLISNTIQSIRLDSKGNAWLGTDKGISKINLTSQTKLLYDYSGKLGNVFSFDYFKNNLFIGTNHGLYEYSVQNNNKLKQIKSGLIWNVSTIDNQLMISDSWGTYIYKNQFDKISYLNGGYKIENFKDKILISTFTGVFTLNKNNNYSTEKIANIYIPIIEFLRVEDKILGIGKNGGLYMFDYGNKNVNEVLYKGKQLLNPQLIKDKNDIYVSVDGNKIVKFNIKKNQFEDYTLNSNLKNISRIRILGNNKFLVEAENVLYYTYIKGNNLVFNFIPKKLYSGKLVDDNLIGKIYKNFLYINLENGILKYDLNEIKNLNPNINILASINSKQLSDNPNIEYANNHIDFNISVINDEFDNYQFFYQLNDNEITVLNQSTITFKQLESGDYNFKIYRLSEGNYDLMNNYQFKIKKIWYLSNGMMIFYFTSLITIGYIFYCYNRLKIDQKVNLKTKELQYQMKVLSLGYEQELKELNYKKEKQLLEDNLNIKSTELASQALKIANQKSLINDITSFFDTIEGKDSEMNRLKRKINKTFSEYTYNQQEWDNFELQIQEIHKDFIQQLTDIFPNLSAKEIKLCIFLRMNLSTKEIAPLMHVNYRTVELQRYRLRKKMNISSEINLNKYFISFKN